MKHADSAQPESEDRGEALSPGLALLPPASGLAELGVLTGLIVLVDRILPDVELADIQPNPFWLPVLLLSLQYGTVSGLLAAGVALLVTVLSGLPPEGIGENHFNYALRVYTQPILWFAAAVILGQFRMRQIAAKAALRKQVDQLTASRATLADYSIALRERCDRLERERAGAIHSPALQLLERLTQLGQGETPLDEAFEQLIATAFPGAAASLFVHTDARLALAATAGWPQDARWQRELGLADPLYRAVVTEGAAVSVLVAGDEHRLGGQGLVAVPIKAGDGAGPVIGMVKLEHADPSDLEASTPRALAAIAALVAGRLVGGGISAADHGPLTSGGDAADAGRGRLLRPLRWLPRLGAGSDTGARGQPPVVPAKPKVVR